MTVRIAARTLARVLVGLVITASGVSAQTPFSASISGTVRDATDAVVTGATVTISAPTLIGGSQVGGTMPDGSYRFTLLPAGSYDIVVHAAGFQAVRRTGVRIASGATATIDFALGLAGVTDEVVVRGPSPVVDVRNPGIPVRLDEDLLQNLPTSRTVESILNLVPGISSDVAFGGSQASNEILADGVRMTEPVFQDPGIRANYNWLQEVNVVALGAPAEYGGFTGAAAYGTLRSGSNKFSWLGEFWTTRPSWLDSNTEELSASLQRQFLSRELLDWRDASAQLGGPVLRDRLWFFTGIQHLRHNDRPAGFSGPGSRDETDLQLLFKPTFSPSPGLRLDGFAQHGRHRITGDAIDAFFPIESSNDIWNPNTSWNVHGSWVVSDRLIVEGRYGGYDSRDWWDPHPPATIDGPYPHYDSGTQTWSQNTNWYLRSDARVQTATASMTRHAEGLLGLRHEFKAGVEYEATSASSEQRYPGGRNYYDYFGVTTQVDVWGGVAGQASTGRNVLHAQDTWAVTDRITVSPGVRFEWNRGSVPGKSNVFQTNTVAPRVGIAWDVTADHRTVARAHYGRYYDTIFSSRIMQADRSDLHPYIVYRVDGPDQWVETFRSTPADNFAIDPNLEHSYVKQLILGFEREVINDVSIQAQYIRRRFDTFMGLTDPRSIYAPVQMRDPGPDGALNTADDGDLLTVFNITNQGSQFDLYSNPEAAYNRYDALQVVGRKRYSRDWQLQSSYTWSRNRGTVGNRWHVNAARFDLGRPGRFVNPNFLINADGAATYDPTHEVKLLGSYNLSVWGGTLVSGVYRYMTGQAWGRVAFFQGFAQGQQRIRIEPQGTRRAPAINRLDLRVEKTAPLPRIGKLGLFFDVFNVWNQGVPNSDAGDAINAASGPRFGEPIAWVDPRMLRVGVRLSF